MSQPNPTKVLIIQGSPVTRNLLRLSLEQFPTIDIIGVATNLFEARDKILAQQPDLLVLDTDIGGQDCLNFLRILMREYPLPTILIGSFHGDSESIALEGLRAGAADVLDKGEPGSPMQSFIDQLAQAIARAHESFRPPPATRWSAVAESAPDNLSHTSSPPSYHPRQIIALAASTGGTEALREVVSRLPAGLPPIVLLQHIPGQFSRAFSERLNSFANAEVVQAESGQTLLPGKIVVAPGGLHMELEWLGTSYQVRLHDGPAHLHQRPSADLLFESVARCGSAPFTVAGLMTGMGRDGAQGLLHLHQKGAFTFVQDEESSTVFGMPRAAWELGATKRMVHLDSIASTIVYASNRIHLKYRS